MPFVIADVVVVGAMGVNLVKTSLKIASPVVNSLKNSLSTQRLIGEHYNILNEGNFLKQIDAKVADKFIVNGRPTFVLHFDDIDDYQIFQISKKGKIEFANITEPFERKGFVYHASNRYKIKLIKNNYIIASNMDTVETLHIYKRNATGLTAIEGKELEYLSESLSGSPRRVMNSALSLDYYPMSYKINPFHSYYSRTYPEIISIIAEGKEGFGTNVLKLIKQIPSILTKNNMRELFTYELRLQFSGGEHSIIIFMPSDDVLKQFNLPTLERIAEALTATPAQLSSQIKRIYVIPNVGNEMPTGGMLFNGHMFLFPESNGALGNGTLSLEGIIWHEASHVIDDGFMRSGLRFNTLIARQADLSANQNGVGGSFSKLWEIKPYSEILPYSVSYFVDNPIFVTKNPSLTATIAHMFEIAPGPWRCLIR